MSKIDEKNILCDKIYDNAAFFWHLNTSSIMTLCQLLSSEVELVTSDSCLSDSFFVKYNNAISVVVLCLGRNGTCIPAHVTCMYHRPLYPFNICPARLSAALG